jgi:hypothetical protein
LCGHEYKKIHAGMKDHFQVAVERDRRSGVPTLDNLRNFLLTTTTEVLSFFQQLREAP